eukprot:288478_1
MAQETSIHSQLLTPISSPKYGSGSGNSIENLSPSPIQPVRNDNDDDSKYTSFLSPTVGSTTSNTSIPSPQPHFSPLHHPPSAFTNNYNNNNDIDDNDNYESIRNDHRIRSIAEVKSYLEHFIPELTSQTVLTCLILRP